MIVAFVRRNVFTQFCMLFFKFKNAAPLGVREIGFHFP